MTPSEVYQEVSRSVYVVRSGETSARIGLGEGRLGSAVAISGSLALTNCHVVKDSPEIYLHRPMGVFSAEHSFRVRVESADETTDRCVLRVLQSPRDELWFDAIASIRANSSVEIGERVYTIGNPQGLTNTLGDGLVSGIRELKDLQYIQTSAPVSKGSSGGALVDAEGSLIGIMTFIIKDGQNLNFAISADEYWR